jgi:hypothetical protein
LKHRSDRELDATKLKGSRTGVFAAVASFLGVRVLRGVARSKSGAGGCKRKLRMKFQNKTCFMPFLMDRIAALEVV